MKDSSIKEYILHSQSDIDSLADDVLDMAIDYGTCEKSALVIALKGELGSGKTTFMKSFARKMGISESVASPTFVIMKRYPMPHESRAGAFYQNLIHIDAYRLEHGKDLETMGFSRLLNPDMASREGRNIVCVEWPEIVENILPAHRLTITFEHMPSDGQNHTGNSEMRKVTIEPKM